jgi:hypothetical protein
MSGFVSVRCVGGALPADVLSAVVGGDQLKGLSADDYHLEFGVSPREAANRAWSVLTGAWAGYRDAITRLGDNDRAVGMTREKWLGVVLRELGFGRVPLSPTGGLTADGRTFPVSHVYDLTVGHVPLHLLGWGVTLDQKTAGQPGAADRAPHAMVQEYLNRSEQALWGIVTNGRTLRLLRDSSTLIGQSYVEFDLEAMFDGDVFSDFVVFFLLCHVTRFEPDRRDDASPADCWLERWRTYAAETGTRALQALSPGVKQAIEAIGTGILRHPANTLHHRLADNTVTAKDLHEALLRLVYRLLFCFVAEDRGLLLDPNAPPLAKQRYTNWFSTSRLRKIATRRRGSAHPDLWQALSVVLDGLGTEGGRPELGLPGLGGLFDTGPADVVIGCQLANEPLLNAIRHLTIVQPAGGGPKRVVDYRNLGAEELGSVYESLLEYVPRYDPHTRTLTLETTPGNDRKTSGAYYTPSSLIDCLLGTALDPLLDQAERADDPETALLELTICDPACGSGHFLVAAARRIAARLAAVRARRDSDGGGEPTVLDEQRAMHDVVDRCIYGVDLNPMAAELAKVSLWLESVQPGRALSFLNAHIKVGNALLGTTPTLLTQGIPDTAYTPLDGDDKKLATSLKKRNKQERGGQENLFGQAGIRVSNVDLGRSVRQVESLPNTSLADVHLAQKRFRDYDTSHALQQARRAADAWCAAFVALKVPNQPEITHATIERITNGGSLDEATAAMLDALTKGYRFFHWHVEFPQIFSASDTTATTEDGPGWRGGFSCVLGNPPWERIKLQEQEFFAAADPEIAGAANAAARKRLIATLAERNPQLHADFEAAKRRADGESQIIRLSGRYPLCGRGDVNTYAVFAEHDRTILGASGRLGVVLPTGIATDATTQHFFKDVVSSKALVSLFDFVTNGRIWGEIGHNRFKFVLLTLSAGEVSAAPAVFAFFLQHPDELAKDGVRFELAPEELLLLNPNTGTCPIFRSRRDAEITLDIYRRWPILKRDVEISSTEGNPWGLSFLTMFHMSSDSDLFRSRDELEDAGWHLIGNVFERAAKNQMDRMLPLYEAKMMHHFDHRWATYDGLETREVTTDERDTASFVAVPKYWVAESAVDDRLASRRSREWALGFRDIARSTDERTMIVAALPRVAVGHKAPLIIVERSPLILGAALASMALDFVARQKIGGTSMGYFVVHQLPVPSPEAFEGTCAWSLDSLKEWIERRVLELTYTANDMRQLAQELGDDGPPFRWNAARRSIVRAELDACFFHLYGLDRSDTAYVLSTFHIANRKDPELIRRILTAYDAMAAAAASATAFVSLLDPPPGFGPRHESDVPEPGGLRHPEWQS